MNRYRDGRREYIPEERRKPGPASPLPPQSQEERSEAPNRGKAEQKKPSGPLGDLKGGLDGILSKLDPSRLETEDLLVLAILWLLYKESGERELLIALVAYLFV